MNPRRITNKIILLVMSLLLFSFLLSGTLTYSSSRDELLITKSAQLNEIAIRLSSEIDNFFLPLKMELDLVSKVFTLYPNIFTQYPDRVDDNTVIQLHRLLNSRDEIEEISIIGSNGKELKHILRLAGNADDQLRDLSDDTLVKKSLAGIAGSDSITFTENFEPTIRLTTVIKSDRENQSILTVINLKWLWDIVQLEIIGDNGILYVVDENFNLVAHPDPSLVLSYTKKDLDLDRTLFDHKSDKELSIYKSITGEEVAGVAYFDPNNNWWIVVEQPVNEALAPLNRVINRFLLAFSLCTFITVLSVFIFSKKVMKPLEELEKGISRLSDGDLNTRVEISDSTEFSSLSVAFNNMAENLNEKTERLKNMMREVEAANSAKSEFLANMSHEFRTPLHAILSYSKLGLKKHKDISTDKLVKYLDNIDRSGSRLLLLVNDLLDLAKLESGKHELNLKNHNLEEMIYQVMQEFEIILNDKNIKIEMQEVKIDSSLVCDAEKIMQVLRNLLSNSIKFTPEGKKIGMALNYDSEDNNYLCFCISDEGVGIPEDELGSIFSKFIQSSKTKDGSGGTGLGLPISEEIVKQHFGTISAVNAEGGGAKFCFTIPVDPSIYDVQVLSDSLDDV